MPLHFSHTMAFLWQETHLVMIFVMPKILDVISHSKTAWQSVHLVVFFFPVVGPPGVFFQTL